MPKDSKPTDSKSRRDDVTQRYQNSVEDGVYPVVRDCLHLPEDLLERDANFRNLSEAPVRRATHMDFQALFTNPVSIRDFAQSRLDPCFRYSAGMTGRGEGGRQDETPLKEASPGHHLRRLRQGRRQRFPGARGDPMADTHLYDLIDNWISGSVHDLDDYYRRERQRFDAVQAAQLMHCLTWVTSLAAAVLFGPFLAAFMPDLHRTNGLLISGGLAVIMMLVIILLGQRSLSSRNAALAVQTVETDRLNAALQKNSRRLSEALGRHLTSLREMMRHMMKQADADKYEAWDRDQPKDWAQGRVIWKLCALWHKERYEALTVDMRDAHNRVETAFRGIRDEALFRHRHYSLNGFYPIDRFQMRTVPWLMLTGIGCGLAGFGLVRGGFTPLALIWICASLAGLLAGISLGWSGCLRLEQGLMETLTEDALKAAAALAIPLEMEETDLAGFDQIMSETERNEALSRLQEEGLRSR